MLPRRSGFFAALSVPARLRLSGFLALLGLGATVGAGLYGLTLANADLEQSMTATSAVLHQKHADMMHDALRADVLSALVLGPDGSTAEKQALIADLRDHGAQFTNALAALETLDLDPAVRDLLVALRPHLDEYLQTAELVIYGGLEGRQSGLNRMGAFTDAFGVLETEMGQLGELIEARGAMAGRLAQDRNRTLIGVLVLASLIAGLVLVVSNLVLSRSITAPLQRVRTAIGDLARSHMSGRDQPARQAGSADEMTEIAHYLDLVGERLREAIAMEQTISRSQAEQHRVVAALSVGLQNLSTGNLSAPIDTAFPPEYEDLRGNFNLTIDRLNQTIARVIEASRSIRQRADGLSGATGDLSQRTENQAATLEETAAALDLLTSNVKAAADGAREVEVIVQAARQEAEISGKVVQDAVTAMTGIEQSSQQISQIIGVIEDIAFQTNLLALNAGVEAARAGDAGRGFAVVASEVRALAQRSSDASRQIKGLITSSTALVERGVDSVDSAGRALTSMAGQVAHISTLVSGIAAASAEQSTGLAEVNIGVTHLDQVAQKNATMVEESMSVTRALLQDAVGLDSLVSQFSILSDARSRRDAA